MKDFDRRWKALAQHAREAAPRDEAVPFGFVTRVLARAHTSVQSTDDLWGRLTLRVLGVAVPVFLVCAMFEGPYLRRSPSLDSGVENTVAQIVWRL
ncbi:MAG: hypothetical protein AB9869_00175 [Verrucomicrobiia bacterium]